MLTADHDGVIVADVVAEWATATGAVLPRLTGPAGGRGSGRGRGAHQMDAIDFCRVVCGRGEARGLLSVQVPF